jgi:hypothetical protein
VPEVARLGQPNQKTRLLRLPLVRRRRQFCGFNECRSGHQAGRVSKDVTVGDQLPTSQSDSTELAECPTSQLGLGRSQAHESRARQSVAAAPCAFRPIGYQLGLVGAHPTEPLFPGKLLRILQLP